MAINDKFQRHAGRLFNRFDQVSGHWNCFAINADDFVTNFQAAFFGSGISDKSGNNGTADLQRQTDTGQRIVILAERVKTDISQIQRALKLRSVGGMHFNRNFFAEFVNQLETKIGKTLYG